MMMMMDACSGDVGIIISFKQKVEEAVNLFHKMPENLKVEALKYWKYVSVTFSVVASPLQNPYLEENHLKNEGVLGPTLLEDCQAVTNGETQENVSGEKFEHTQAKSDNFDLQNEKTDLADPNTRVADYLGRLDIKSDNNESAVKAVPENCDPDLTKQRDLPAVAVVTQKKSRGRKKQLKTEKANQRDKLEETVKHKDPKDCSKQTEMSSVRKSSRIHSQKDNKNWYSVYCTIDSDGEIISESVSDGTGDVQAELSEGIASEQVFLTLAGKHSEEKENSPVKKEKEFSCDQCEAVLSNGASLIVHKRKHSGERPYSCGICGRAFSTRGNQLRHEKTHSGEKPFECAECKKCFTENKSLKVHMRKHTGERPYKCNVCGRGFAQSGILQTHMHLHTGHKGHLCDTCGKAFRQKSQLRLHEKRHLNHRAFKCSECESCFITKGDLDRHKLKHTGERPFLCTLCPKTFTRLQYLKEHMNQHTGNRPYICKICNSSFCDMSTYYRHSRKHKTEEVAKQNEQVFKIENESLSTTNLMTYIVTTDTDQTAKSLTTDMTTIQQTSQPEVYQITVDPSLISGDQTQHVVTAVDFSAINLLANATTQDYMQTS